MSSPREQRPEFVVSLAQHVANTYPFAGYWYVPLGFAVLSPVQPCELCGTPIVLLSPDQNPEFSTWAHVGPVYSLDGQPHINMSQHDPNFCRTRRVEALS